MLNENFRKRGIIAFHHLDHFEQFWKSVVNEWFEIFP
jgi:hypothetical protein